MRNAARILLPLLGAILSGGSAPAEEPRLGKIDFPTSGSAEAQKHFLRGVLLLHSFEYDDAREEFLAAEKREPGFAMAYWGEAMTFNHPIWMEQDRDAARFVLARLTPAPGTRVSNAATEREKGYLRAVDVLFGEGEKKERDVRYAEEMRALFERYPDDAEAASFYALSLLGACHDGRNFSTYMKAAGILEAVFQKNPEHPGAVHYLIHSYDDPIHAPLGLRPARVYAMIAGAAGHAQHMPSHIFLALGMWDETAASNETAWRVSEERLRRKNLSVDELNYHALYWLEYAYLQQGRFRDARALVARMEENAEKSASPRALMHLARMRAAETVESRHWRGVAKDPTRASGSGAAAEQFSRGFAAIRSGDPGGARLALGSLHPTNSADRGRGHGMGGRYSAESGATGVLEQELRALIAIADGKRDEGIAALKAAAAAEDGMTFEFGPPDIVKPTHELLGEVLLEANRPQEAKLEFEKSLARNPGRALSLRGLEIAASRAGDRAAAEHATAEWKRIRRHADPGPPID